MDVVNRKITYKLYPNVAQEARLQQMLELHCRVYNALLEEHRRRYEAGEERFGFVAMCRELTLWRAAVPALYGLNAQSMQVTAKRGHLAFEAFFRRLKAGETPGYPRFKAAKRFSGFGFKTHGDGWRLEQAEATGGRSAPRAHRLRLSGVGVLRIRGKGRFCGAPKTCEIFLEHGYWYASVTFAVEASAVARRRTGAEVGAFDWGVKTLLTIAKADGEVETVGNPRHLQRRLEALVVLQRTVSREELRAKALLGLAPEEPIPAGTRLPVTPRLKRLYRQVGALHQKIARQRHDFYHKLSAELVARFSSLATEELSVASMVASPEALPDGEGGFLPNGAARQSGLSRGILDAAPNKLLQMLATKAEEAASHLHLAPTRRVKPTQRCHRCGVLVPKSLDCRRHVCPRCGEACDRDENAAKTLLRWHLQGDFWLFDEPPWAGTVQPCTPGMEETPSIAGLSA